MAKKYIPKIHINECCRIHGCALGDQNHCDVWLGYEVQNYLCSECVFSFDGAEIIDDLPVISPGEFEDRRQAANDAEDDLD